MPIETTLTLYTYDELSSNAKEVAKDWYRECLDETDYESTIDDFINVAKLLGFEMKTRTVELMSGKTRQDPCVWYSVAYCQGDFAAFDGHYRYAKGTLKAIREYAPIDTALHGLAERLQEMQKASFYQLCGTVSHHHYYGIQTELVRKTRDDELAASSEAESAFNEIVKDLCRWLYRQLRTETEWLTGDENIADVMQANEYTFREDGRREG